MIAVKRMIRKGAPCLSSFSRSSSPRQWCFVCSPSPPTRVANRKSRPGGHRTAHFRNCRLGGRFHRCDFGEADRVRSFRPLIGRYAGVGRSARLSIDYSLKFYRQRQDKIRVKSALQTMTRAPWLVCIKSIFSITRFRSGGFDARRRPLGYFAAFMPMPVGDLGRFFRRPRLGFRGRDLGNANDNLFGQGFDDGIQPIRFR
jgi:hypothetical protein